MICLTSDCFFDEIYSPAPLETMVKGCYLLDDVRIYFGISCAGSFKAVGFADSAS